MNDEATDSHNGVSKGIAAVIELTATRTAEKTVLKHRENCPITSVVTDLYGRGMDQPGMKDMVLQLIAGHKSQNSFLKNIGQTVIAAAIICLIVWGLNIYKNTGAEASAGPRNGNTNTVRPAP